MVRESASGKNARARVDGSVIRIRIPSSWPREEGFKAFLDLEKRVLEKLAENPKAFAQPRKNRQISFRDGQEVTLMGKRFLLKKIAGRGESTSSARLDGETVVVRLCPNLPPEQEGEAFSNLARRVIAGAVRPEVEARVRKLNGLHFQGDLSRVFIKDNVANFGSCSSKGNVNLSFRVLFAPDAVLDYLILHELAHLKERNHSPAFWALVEQAMPNYRENRRWLKDNGHKLGAMDA